MSLHQPRNVVERQPSIEDVFNQNHVAIGERLVEVFGQSDFAERIPCSMASGICQGSRAVAVTGNTDKVEGRVKRNLARQIAKEYGCTFQNAYKNDRLAVKISRNFFSEFGDPLGNGLA